MGSLKELFESNWGSIYMIYDSKKINLLEIEHIEISNDSTVEGILTFFEDQTDVHIVSLNAFVFGKGIGSQLLEELESIAKGRKKKTIFVETTNDNCKAIKFYQTHGFDMYQLKINEVSSQRILKPSIPLNGCYGIPIKHIIKFKKCLPNFSHYN